MALLDFVDLFVVGLHLNVEIQDQSLQADCQGEGD